MSLYFVLQPNLTFLFIWLIVREKKHEHLRRCLQILIHPWLLSFVHKKERELVKENRKGKIRERIRIGEKERQEWKLLGGKEIEDEEKKSENENKRRGKRERKTKGESQMTKQTKSNEKK